ncbi:3-oxoacyl-(acyl-carrier-protein) reductase [Mycolicibacterium rhodesiae JS60]|nr:3-oxoacyl-(acyl-carrier-protein) reductase [Mycolicibacterium rhodesiae JS60]
MTLGAQRVAVVTGAARGIGAAVAHRLAADGLAVAVLDRDGEGAQAVASSIGGSGGRAMAVTADITSAEQIEEAIASVCSGLGDPTVLVNNAGVTRDNLLFRMTREDWDTVIAVHLTGAYLMTAAVQRFMVAAGFGRIVNLSSVAALGNRGQTNYSAAKAGLIGMAKTLAIELGKFGVTANAIAPGFISTEMTAATAARLGMSLEELAAQYVVDIPVGRPGVPDDIANVVSFFVDERSGFVSGQVIYVAGGPKA